MGHSIHIIKIALRGLLLVSLILTMALSAEAAKKKRSKRKRRSKGQWAFVIVDGAAVYQVPNFDSPILEYLDREKKIRVSKKLYNGIGGLGAFYKVRLAKKRYGYITDVDLRLPNGKFRVAKSADTLDSVGSDPFGNQLSDNMATVEEPKDMQSIYFTRYAGLVYSSYGYTDEINNQDRSAATSFFGFKLTGPGALLGGAPMDVEVLYSTGPSYYGELFSKASGFLLIFNTQLLLPFMEWPNALLYYGGGVVLTYSNFTLNNTNPPVGSGFNSEEVRAGLAFSGGGAYRFMRKWVFRGEGKYFYEKKQYFGFGASLQYKW